MDITWEELKIFLTELKNLPVSASIPLGEAGFAVSTGCDIESWVFYPERINDIKTAQKAIEFFKAQKVSFMWPVYNGGERVLEDAGLHYAGSLAGMLFDPVWHEMMEPFFPKAESNIDPNSWAKTAWYAFGGDADEVPEKYFELAKAFSENPNFYIYVHRTDDNIDGCFMLRDTSEKFAPVGVYYFATVPEARRKGVASAMMRKICSLARGRKILLQSTPAGLPFYKTCMFEELCKIPVYSDTSDVF